MHVYSKGKPWFTHAMRVIPDVLMFIVPENSLEMDDENMGLRMCFYFLVHIYPCNRPRLGPMPSAFDPPQDKAVTITFSAVLPKDAWEWDNKSSSVYMRFMGADLNTRDVGPGACRHLVDDQFLVMFTVKMHVDMLTSKRNIFYKYVVFSRRMEEVGHPHEHLHGAPYGTGFTNRVLKITQSNLVPGG